MTFEIIYYDTDAIILETMGGDFSIKADLAESIQQVRAILDGSEIPHSFIIDAKQLKMSFGDMVIGMATVTRGETPIFKHPNLREIVVVTASDLIELTSKAFGQPQYGGVNVRIFGSLEEALMHAREYV